MRHYLEWVWVLLGGGEVVLGGWGIVGVGGTLFWVGEGEWENMLGGWGWMGVGALFDNARF